MHKQRIKNSVRKYFIHSEVYMILVGSWPRQSAMSKKFFRYFWATQHISIILAEAIKMIENKRNINLIIESLAPFTYNVGIAFKFINGIVNQRKITTVLDKVKSDWESPLDKRELSVLHYYANKGRILNIGYITLIYIVLLTFMLYPLQPIVLDVFNPLNESRRKSPLYMVEFFVDEDKYFYPILMHAYVTSLAGIMPLFAGDTFLSNCVHHACGMITILGHRIQKVLKEKNANEKLNCSECKEIIDCVKRHQSVIEFCDNINKIYSTTFFFVLSVCIFMMSITGVVAIIKLEENIGDSIRFAMFTIAQIFHMYCYNFMGQNLLNFGEKLNSYMYNSDWYATSIKTKNVLKFMIMRSLKPSKIQAKIFPLTLENFTSVMKTSMSYFTVLKSTR